MAGDRAVTGGDRCIQTVLIAVLEKQFGNTHVLPLLSTQ